MVRDCTDIQLEWKYFELVSVDGERLSSTCRHNVVLRDMLLLDLLNDFVLVLDSYASGDSGVICNLLRIAGR